MSYSFSILTIPVERIPRRGAIDYSKPTIVWSANNDNLVLVNAVLELTDKGGLVLKDSDKDSTVWSAGTSGEPVTGINLTDTGNLVLFNKNDGIVWQSFDHPTDTLLGGQKLMVGMKLVSRVSEKNWTGQSRFSITLMTNGLYVTAGSKSEVLYYSWPSELSDDGYVTMLNGNLTLFSSGSALGKEVKVINTIPVAVSSNYICLDIDGHLRAYGYDDSGWSLMMGDLLPLETCQYPTVCGPYGICSNGQCTCPPSSDGVIYFNPVSHEHPELGCSPNVPLTCEDSQNQTFLEVKGVTYFSFRIDIVNVDVNRCKDACMENCSCKAAFFRQPHGQSLGVCFLTSEMFSMMNMDNGRPLLHDYAVFLKVHNRTDNAGSADKIPTPKRKKTFLQKAKGASIGVSIAFVFVTSATLLLLLSKIRLTDETEEDHVEEMPGMPTRFTYSDLITDNFSQKLGEGGSGVVFKGIQHDGTKVAVKRLDGSRHMKKSFLNEVGAIGSIHHINMTDFRNRPSMSTVIKVLDGVIEVKDELVYDFTHPTLTRLIPAQSPIANVPSMWRSNRLEDHTLFFGESILRAILYREAGYVKYACGFYCEANCKVPRFSFSVLLIADHAIVTPPVSDGSFNPTVIWSSNGDNLVSANAILELTDEGNLVFKDSDKDSTVWSAGTSGKNVAGINLTDTGNLVLFDKDDQIVWQSFNHPTDTLLSGQKMMVGNELVTIVSEANRLEQTVFSLALTTHGLYATVGRKTPLSYFSFHHELSHDSYLTISDGSVVLQPKDTTAGADAKLVVSSTGFMVTARYFRMHADGHLRAYGYDALGGSRKMGDVLPLGTCQYPTVCGPYGICSNGQCSCPPPRDGINYFSPVSFRQPELGCSLNVPLNCGDSKNQNFLEIEDVTYFHFRADIVGVDAKGCRDACSRNCSCKAAFFKHSLDKSHGACFLPSELFSLINVDGGSGGVHNYTMFLKVQNHVDAVGITKGMKTFLQLTRRAGPGVIIAFMLLSSAVLLQVWRKMCLDKEAEKEDDYMEDVPGMPARFTYSDLQSITNDFSQKLGEGGFGAVFRGTLRDGTKVAVKRLDNSRHMKKSFLNEVGTIGSIHHINLVKLLGFCAEKSHRLLVYEYMSNGSLDKWIFGNSSGSDLDWQKRMDIILDIAKGLHYLHEECKQKIVHLDIKPQNILLDDNLRGKVCDFGLSKLVDRENDQVMTTAVRGTPGYLAPEWLNGMITEKADVYSFGVVILEIILGKKVFDTQQGPEDADLLKLFEGKAKGGRLTDLLRPYGSNLSIDDSVVSDNLRAMRIASWCLQTDFRNRPSMSTVIKVLDGVMEVTDNLVYDFARPVFTQATVPVTVLSPSMLSGPR
ncbi:hypothetical protein MLD38_015843 [Melastoma candidum]|uniref:Uncharacterized protein n=1 Tax=Melastoma candidum TaxID=119954 RepID=A0ACB9RQX9_9MYRT|nr:hypothetical protein MLD38_015843 [Melastoma candidum]